MNLNVLQGIHAVEASIRQLAARCMHQAQSLELYNVHMHIPGYAPQAPFKIAPPSIHWVSKGYISMLDLYSD